MSLFYGYLGAAGCLLGGGGDDDLLRGQGGGGVAGVDRVATLEGRG